MVKLSVRHMEVIRAVLDAGTMSGAAAELGVSQPAISRMVSHAEHRSGLRLFVREGTRLIPTPEALELRKDFERVFLNVGRAQRLALALSQGWGRIVRLAAMPSLSTTLVSGAISRLVADQPKVKVVLRVHELGVIEERVALGDFDLGLVNAVNGSHELAAVPLGEVSLVCVLRPDHPLARQSSVSVKDIAHLPLISISSVSPIGARLDKIFESEGLQRQVAVQTSQTEIAAQLVALGTGVAIVEPSCLEAVSTRGLVIRQFEPAVAVCPHVIHQRGRVLSAPELALVELLQQEGRRWSQEVASALAEGQTGI
jgi:DNA-binding transcriptional LysR family regulator